jgi:hypothetical protein
VFDVLCDELAREDAAAGRAAGDGDDDDELEALGLEGRDDDG